MLDQYQKAIEQSNIISKTDINGIITFVNDEFCEISGYTKEELIGQNHNIVRHPDVPANTFKNLWETIKAKKTYKATVKNKAKDGSTFYVNTTVTPILNEKNEIVEYIAIRYDVTKEVLYKQALEKKEKELEDLNLNLEAKVQAQTKELKKLNENLELRVQEEIAKNNEKQKIMFWQSRLASLGQMLANIAHQWRQPLTELNLALFNIKKAATQNNAHQMQEYYEQSKTIIQNMSSTIEDFTNFFNPNKQKDCFDIVQSINETLQIMEKTLKKENIKLTQDCHSAKVIGVSNELSQILINLIQNSKDAFIQNNVHDRKIFIYSKKYEGNVIICIEDNAGGIDSAILDKIFEPYFTTKHSSKGIGLGLFMSKMICEQSLNGKIEIRNIQNGTQACITITLGENCEH